MSADSRKRAELVRARSAQSAQVKAAETGKDLDWDPSPTPFYVAGFALVLPALGMVSWLYVLGLGGAPLEEGPALTPAVLLFLAGIPFFFAEMFRRAQWETRARGPLQSGSVAITIHKTQLWVALVWLLVPLAAFLVLVGFPVLAERGGGVLGATMRGASGDFWETVEVYGILAGGVFGVMLATLLKRATYERLAARFGPPPARGRGFWRTASTQWRGETWLSFISGGAFAELPMVWHRGNMEHSVFDYDFLHGMTAFAVICGALCIGLTLNAWRSGVQYGTAESI